MVCLDANVLIEIILDRKTAETCRKYIDSTKEDLAITLLTLDLVMYYAERNKLNLESVKQFLRQFIWLPITDTDAEKAFEIFTDKDYEDGLQIACALREKCKRFATLDQALAKKYTMSIPVDLLA